MDGPSEQLRARIAGYLFALLIGPLTIALVHGCLWLVAGRDPNLQEERGPLIAQAVLVAIPFFHLALTGVVSKTPWTAAVILTAMFWGFLLIVALAYRGPNDANIGLGMLMLISPLIIIAGGYAADLVAKRRRNGP